MNKYRINVRFDIDDPKQAEAVKFLQSLEYSRNAFIVSVVLDAISWKSAANSISLEDIRRIIQEELQEVSFVTVPSAFQSAKTELTEEEQAENEKSVLDGLEMFGWAKTPIFGSMTRYAPMGNEAVFGIVQRRNALKLRHLKVAYYYSLWDLSYGITSRELVRQVPNKQ